MSIYVRSALEIYASGVMCSIEPGRHCTVMQCVFIIIVAAELIVEFFLDASAPPLGLRATLNPLFSEPPSNLFVQGLFGVRRAPNKECIYLQSSTQSFADSDTVFIELNLVLKFEQYEYCARAILNGRENTIVDGKYTGSYSIWL